MNLKENIIIFELPDNLKQFIDQQKMQYKKIYANISNQAHAIMFMFDGKRIESILKDFGIDNYYISWSDRYTERLYLDGTKIGLGSLVDTDDENYDFTDGYRKWKFSVKE